MSNYSKHKERKPEDTIFYVQSILNRANLFTTVDWIEKPFDGVRSNRVSIYPTKLGTNGKGTDEVYTLASGYAELMERIQNNLLALRYRQPALYEYGGFERQPDERVMSVEELISQDDPFLTNLFHKTGMITEGQKAAFLRNSAELFYQRQDGCMPVVPFADLHLQRVVWLPLELVHCVHGSNGMAAGNTIEEALVQGTSELFERYVNAKLLRGECVPPQIPDEALQGYSIWSLIEQIRRDGRYDVRVLDCTLGRDIPVCATMIIDREQGKFSMKLGSHPSFAVSVERTLTETFQGKGIRTATGFNRLGSLKESASYHNIPNVAKLGYGVYPWSVLTGEPQWSYRPWKRWEGLDNRGFLRQMLELLREMGFHPLVRDVSFMGFPSCFVLIPNLSEIYPLDSLCIRTANTLARNAEAFCRFPDLSEEEEARFLSLIRFKEGSLLENSLANMVLRPIEGKLFTADRIGAFLSLKRGDYPLSMHFFEKLLAAEQDEEEKRYLRCMIEYIRSRSDGLDRGQAEKAVCLLFGEGTARRVLDETAEPATMLQKVFPRLHCFDCENCPLSGVDCLNLREVEVFKRIKDAMKETEVSQEKLLDNLLQLLRDAG